MTDALIAKVAVSTARLNPGQIALIVGTCPFCGKTHTHGGGTDLAEIRGDLGTRVSHCHRGGYQLIMADNLMEATP